MPGHNHPTAEEGYALMGAAFEVHNVMGGGLLEEIYQQALELELRSRAISYQPKASLDVCYKDTVLPKQYVPDLIVSGDIVVELKAVRGLELEHEAQMLNYLRVARRPIGYLINFAPIAAVEYKRFILSEFAANSCSVPG